MTGRPWGQIHRRARRLLDRRLLDRTPLRIKLVLLMSGLATIALVLVGVATITQLRSYLYGRLDSQLVLAAGQITHRASNDGPNAQEFHGGPSGGGGGPPVLPSDYYEQIYDASGSVMGAPLSNPLRTDESPPSIPSLTLAQVKARGQHPFTVGSTAGGGRWRVVLLPLSDGSGSVAVATSVADVDSTLERLTILEATIGAGVLIALAAIGYVAVRRSLRPLVDVEHTAAAIAAGDLSRRVADGDPRTEVGGLSLALNGMLSQIESAFRDREASEQQARASESRMRRFITDASHELRTPLTSIRGFAELYRLGAVVGPDDVDRVMGRIEAEAARMGLLVEDLLLLARLDQQRPLQRELVDLRLIAADAAHDARAVAPGRDVRTEIDPETPSFVVGDEARLRQVVGNLVTNALTHTPQSASVTIGTAVCAVEGASWATLWVADTGPGLSSDDAARVFERFYRVEQSRTRNSTAGGNPAGGSGLGLSIVAALVAAHGGMVDVDTTPGAGATFTVRLPLAPDPDAPALKPEPQADRLDPTTAGTAPGERGRVPLDADQAAR